MIPRENNGKLVNKEISYKKQTNKLTTHPTPTQRGKQQPKKMSHATNTDFSLKLLNS